MKIFSISAILCSLVILAECHHESNHNPNGPVYDGLDTVLEEAAKQAQIFADDLTQRMNKTFHSIKNKVESWKTNNAITQQLESFVAEGTQCIKDNELELAQFMRNLISVYDSCAHEVKQLVSEKLNALKDSITIIKDAPTFVDDISEKCFPQEKLDLAVSTFCVVTRIAEIELLTSEANLLVEKFIDNGAEEIEAFAVTNCKGIKNLDKEFAEIFNKIQACIQNNTK